MSDIKVIDGYFPDWIVDDVGEYLATDFPFFYNNCLLYTSPSPRDATLSRMPSSA